MAFVTVPSTIYVSGARSITVRPVTLYVNDDDLTAAQNAMVDMTADSDIGTADVRSNSLTCDRDDVPSYLIQ